MRVMRLALAGMLMAAVCLPTLAGAQQYAERQLLLQPVHYDLDLRPDYETEQLVARIGLTVRNASEQATRELPILLYRLMQVTSLTDEQGNAVPFTQRVVAFEDWSKFQTNYVEATLPEPLAPGEEATVTLTYEGHLLGYTETGMSYVRDRIDPAFTIIRMDADAYPRIGYPSRKVNRAAGLPDYTFRAAVTVPESLQVANLHRLVERRAAEGVATYVYESLEPSWRMDFAIAKYEVLEGQGLTLFYFPEDAEGAARAAASRGAVRGDRDPRRLGVAGRRHRRHPGGRGLSGCDGQPRGLSRGFPLLERRLEGHILLALERGPGLVPGVPDRRSPGGGQRVGATHGAAAGVGAGALRGPAAVARNPDDPLPGGQYRGFHVLYDVVGPERFNRIIGGFYQTYADSGATTDEFVAYAKGIGGGDLDALFQDWLYTTRWYDYVSAGEGIEELAARYR
jgi:hypothetical protein